MRQTNLLFIRRDIIIRKKVMSVCRRRNAINVWMHQASHLKQTNKSFSTELNTTKKKLFTMASSVIKKQDSYNDVLKKSNKISVDGYIRQIEQNSFSIHTFYRNIPIVINYLCMKYYHESKDRFDPGLHGDDVITTNNKITKRRYKWNSGSAFLSNIVSKDYHEWRFEVVNFSYMRFEDLHFGICNNEIDLTKYLNTICFPLCGIFNMELETKSFGFNVWDRDLRDRDKKIFCPQSKTTGYIVDMCLDLNALELRFKINHKDYGKAFDIPAGSTWRACVTLYGEDIMITLVHYKRK